MMNELELVTSKELRDKLSDRYDVLEKVKSLLLVPDTDYATINMVAEFYEVEVDTIRRICQRNKEELYEDGIITMKRDSFLTEHHVQSKKLQGKSIITYSNGQELIIPNRGVTAFPRRAILRVGMLLRDSVIAKEVRTQLLNIEEKTTIETKIIDITEEQTLALEMGLAIASGDLSKISVATGKMMEFKNRHIKELESDNNILINDNKALSNGILEWSDRSKFNAGMRKLCIVCKLNFGDTYSELYKNLKYKYHIDLNARKGSGSIISKAKESEWDIIIKTFSALCEKYEQSPTLIMKGI